MIDFIVYSTAAMLIKNFKKIATFMAATFFENYSTAIIHIITNRFLDFEVLY